MEFLEIKNARYLDGVGELIDLTLVTSDGEIPFTYSANDGEAASLFVRERMGTFPISPYTPPPPTPLSELKAAKRAEIAHARWAQETGGYAYGGHTFHSDRESQFNVFAAYMEAKGDPEYSKQWKTMEGWVTLTASDFILLCEGFMDYKESLYVKEATLCAAVDGASSADDLALIEW
ncbi:MULTISPECIES: DUF4376 domain-containing protein [Aminobacterium]|jgi:hypothetical protein|uniref:DUF4376 domain-containing protein n=1 Tax=Aminobacterium TaxID=81466 RepID=UPI00257B38A7|nr:DUF4376 domain-containing protein [Aminobacterium sp. UBA4987]